MSADAFRALAAGVVALLASGAFRPVQSGAVLVLETSRQFRGDSRAAERILNAQAEQGYRLVSLRDFQVWEAARGEPAPEYRIALEPDFALWPTEAMVRDANRRFAESLNALARDGFRVHRQAMLGFTSFWRGDAVQAAVLLERTADRGATCRYDIVDEAAIREGGQVPLRGAIPLPLDLRGVLTESCGTTDLTSAPGLVLRWLDGRRWSELLTHGSADGCRYFQESVVRCGGDGSAEAVAYRQIDLRAGERVLVDTAAAFAVVQARLNEAGAEGFCLVGATRQARHVLVLERPRPAEERCEYRLVVAGGERVTTIVNQALAHGYYPTWRTRPTQAYVLERRRPA